MAWSTSRARRPLFQIMLCSVSDDTCTDDLTTYMQHCVVTVRGAGTGGWVNGPSEPRDSMLSFLLQLDAGDGVHYVSQPVVACAVPL